MSSEAENKITDLETKIELLKSENEELTHFVYRVSHDLRAPIASVEGLINIMKLELKDSSDGIEPLISLLEERIQHLDRFIQDILSYSRNIRTSPTTERIDFNEIIASCFEELRYLDQSRSIEKEVRISGGDLYSDTVRIYEIFRNLISNAIKYADSVKPIRKVIIDIEISDEEARLKISDNGIGVHPAVQPRIFEMFFRGHESSKGSGIGLYLVRQAVDKLNGSIGVNSVPGKGTEFTILLPNQPKPVKE